MLSKTESVIHKVPITYKILSFFKSWYADTDSDFLLHTYDGKGFKYRNYYRRYFMPLMENLELHCCRHTFVSMLAAANVAPTLTKKIVWHSDAMTLTEKIYTHLDVEELVNAINKIYYKRDALLSESIS